MSGMIRSVNSTTSTSEPSRRQTLPSSMPMYPPPTTSSLAGTGLKFSAPVESTTCLPSYFSPGSSIGADPVAIRTFLAVSRVTLPSIPVTSTAPAPASLPVPMTESTLFFLNRKPTPPVNCLTTWSLRASRASRSTVTSPVLMPWCDSLFLAS